MRWGLMWCLLAGCASSTPAPTPAAEAAAEPAAEPVVAEAPAADPLPAQENAVEPQHLDEKVTVVNPTAYTIDVKVVAAAPDKEPAEVSFGPIAPGEQASGNLMVWNHGTFTVTASWDNADGEHTESRPYTAAMSPADPVTPVTLTLDIPSSSGSMGLWKGVEWEMPPGME